MSLLSLFSKERPSNDPGIIENLRKKTHEKITNLIGPLAQVHNWVKEKLDWLFPKDQPEPGSSEAVKAKVESEPMPSSPLEEAEQQHRIILEKMLKGFETATQSPEVLALRHGDGKDQSPERKPELDALAQSRFSTMKTDGEKWLEEEVKKMIIDKKSPEEIEQFRREREGGYLLDHNEEWLEKNHCAENILNGYYGSGKEIAQAFLKSDKHRRNILGTYKEMGLAIESLKDVETGEQMYFAVCLYKNGTQHPVEVPPSIEAPHTSEEAREDISSIYFQAFEKELAEVGLQITIEKDEELTNKKLKIEEMNRGTFIASFTCDGKTFHYIVHQVPPLFIRLNEKNQQIKTLLPHEVVDDFKNALAESTTAEELHQQFDLPAATEGIPEAEQEEETEIVGLK